MFEGNANEGPSFVGRGGHRSHGRPFVKAGEGALGGGGERKAHEVQAPYPASSLHHEATLSFRSVSSEEIGHSLRTPRLNRQPASTETSTPSAAPRARGKRAMDSFLDEIKRCV